MSKIIFGCGYLGSRVAKLWLQQGHMVMAVTRSDSRAIELGAGGIFTVGADVTRPATLDCLNLLPKCSSMERIEGPKRIAPIIEANPIETALYSVGFDHTIGQSIHDVYALGLQNVLSALPSTVPRVIYISTTGVYGNSRDGEWVDELTPPDPQREGGRASLAAEQVLASHPIAKNSLILRLAGIYGPGRIPFLEKLRAGEPIPAASEGYLNLIHVDDAATVVTAAAQLPPFDDGPRIYCVSDGHPAQRGDYYREVARRLGASPPTFVKPDLNSPRAARAEANRRINNERMLSDLGVTLHFPDCRAGLAAILTDA